MSASTAPRITLQPRMPDAPHLVNLLSTPKRIRAYLGDRLIADSRAVLTLRANHFLPVYYFPVADIDMACLVPSGSELEQPALGRASSVWDVRTGDEVRPAAAWSFAAPADDALAALSGYVAFDFKRMSRWFEEGEEVFVHPRDPYARIEVLDGDSLIEVHVRGRPVARSERARLLIETHLPVRYYLPKADIDMSVMMPSPLRTRCPYKGEASYWSAQVDGDIVENIAWSYENPIPEMSRIDGMVCFYNDRVDAITRDGITLSPFGL